MDPKEQERAHHHKNGTSRSGKTRRIILGNSRKHRQPSAGMVAGTGFNRDNRSSRSAFAAERVSRKSVDRPRNGSPHAVPKSNTNTTELINPETLKRSAMMKEMLASQYMDESGEAYTRHRKLKKGVEERSETQSSLGVDTIAEKKGMTRYRTITSAESREGLETIAEEGIMRENSEGEEIETGQENSQDVELPHRLSQEMKKSSGIGEWAKGFRTLPGGKKGKAIGASVAGMFKKIGESFAEEKDGNAFMEAVDSGHKDKDKERGRVRGFLHDIKGNVSRAFKPSHPDSKIPVSNRIASLGEIQTKLEFTTESPDKERALERHSIDVEAPSVFPTRLHSRRRSATEAMIEAYHGPKAQNADLKAVHRLSWSGQALPTTEQISQSVLDGSESVSSSISNTAITAINAAINRSESLKKNKRISFDGRRKEEQSRKSIDSRRSQESSRTSHEQDRFESVRRRKKSSDVIGNNATFDKISDTLSALRSTAKSKSSSHINDDAIRATHGYPQTTSPPPPVPPPLPSNWLSRRAAVSGASGNNKITLSTAISERAGLMKNKPKELWVPGSGPVQPKSIDSKGQTTTTSYLSLDSPESSVIVHGDQSGGSNFAVWESRDRTNSCDSGSAAIRPVRQNSVTHSGRSSMHEFEFQVMTPDDLLAIKEEWKAEVQNEIEIVKADVKAKNEEIVSLNDKLGEILDRLNQFEHTMKESNEKSESTLACVNGISESLKGVTQSVNLLKLGAREADKSQTDLIRSVNRVWTHVEQEIHPKLETHASQFDSIQKQLDAFPKPKRSLFTRLFDAIQRSSVKPSLWIGKMVWNGFRFVFMPTENLPQEPATSLFPLSHSAFGEIPKSTFDRTRTHSVDTPSTFENESAEEEKKEMYYGSLDLDAVPRRRNARDLSAS